MGDGCGAGGVRSGWFLTSLVVLLPGVLLIGIARIARPVFYQINPLSVRKIPCVRNSGAGNVNACSSWAPVLQHGVRENRVEL